MSNAATSQAEMIAELLIKQIEDGTAPWQKPWDPTKTGGPHNALTGSQYKGGNALYLMALQTASGYDDPRWMTYKQAQSVGAQVRKGEKSATIVHYKFDEERKVQQPDGSYELVKEKLNPPRAFPAKVFNATQIDGLEPYNAPEITWNPNERAEALLAASGAKIAHDAGDNAYYSPVHDDIHLPDRAAFPDESRYYATALHELGHWTGHESRLDRDLSGRFGSESYAKEELRAEIASMLIAGETGVPNQPHNNAAYVKSWVKVLKDDPHEISRAARDAELITRYVMDFEKTLEKEKALENEQEKTEDRLFTMAQETKGFLHPVGEHHMLVSFQGEHDLGVAWRDLHKGVFLAGKEDTINHFNDDTSRWLAPLTDNTVLHGMENNTKPIIESVLKDTPPGQSLFVIGDDDTKQQLKEHYPRVHVMTPKDISYGAKSFMDAVKDKGVEHSRRVIDQARYGSQHRWERTLASQRENEKALQKETTLERD
ncbi:ArdC family protein [Scandinavium goeteborgense]|uniref:ArdC family protein n=1 Tax=Scandinavium goeteborgense TaxID=1851514 RepID=UPI0038129106